MKSLRALAAALAVTIPLSLSPLASAANELPGVGGVTYDEAANTLTIAIPYSGRNPYRVLWLPGRNKRLVVDIEGMRIYGKRSLFIGGGVVTRIRAGEFKYGVTRIVFDLARNADLRTVTDGATHTLLLTVYPYGTEPQAATAPTMAYRPTPAPQPHHAGQAMPTPQPMETPVPNARITPVPVFTPSTMPTPMPEMTMAPTPPASAEPTPVPLPSELPSPMETPPEQATSTVAPTTAMVFGSRVYAGADLPLSLTETYPAGGSDSNVATIIPAGAFGWDQMFTPNFGISLFGHAMSYTLSDQAAADAGLSITHRRDDYEGEFGLRGRLPLPAGLEVMLQPGFMVRDMNVSSNSTDAAGNTAAADATSYLYSGFLGYGPAVVGGLGWHVWGPLTIATTGEFDYLLGGSMSEAGVSSVFPMTGIKAGGELRLDFGMFGLTGGYNITSYGFNGGSSDDTLSQNWGGPFLKLNVIY
ncbi:MAG TPA: hypothetical protein V6D47_15110 [Oscillatoriaceae cyanobacterium]